MQITLKNLLEHRLKVESTKEIGTCLTFAFPDSPIVGELYGVERDAIAAHIAKCVKRYPELIEGLKKMQAIFEDVGPTSDLAMVVAKIAFIFSELLVRFDEMPELKQEQPK